MVALVVLCIMDWNKNYMKEECIPATANSYRDDAYAGNKTYVGQGVVATSGSAQYDVQGNIISDTENLLPILQR